MGFCLCSCSGRDSRRWQCQHIRGSFEHERTSNPTQSRFPLSLSSVTTLPSRAGSPCWPRARRGLLLLLKGTAGTPRGHQGSLSRGQCLTCGHGAQEVMVNPLQLFRVLAPLRALHGRHHLLEAALHVPRGQRLWGQGCEHLGTANEPRAGQREGQEEHRALQALPPWGHKWPFVPKRDAGCAGCLKLLLPMGTVSPGAASAGLVLQVALGDGDSRDRGVLRVEIAQSLCKVSESGICDPTAPSRRFWRKLMETFPL